MIYICVYSLAMYIAFINQLTILRGVTAIKQSKCDSRLFKIRVVSRTDNSTIFLVSLSLLLFQLVMMNNLNLPII